MSRQLMTHKSYHESNTELSWVANFWLSLTLTHFHSWTHDSFFYFFLCFHLPVKATRKLRNNIRLPKMWLPSKSLLQVDHQIIILQSGRKWRKASMLGPRWTTSTARIAQSPFKDQELAACWSISAKVTVKNAPIYWVPFYLTPLFVASLIKRKCRSLSILMFSWGNWLNGSLKLTNRSLLWIMSTLEIYWII